MVCALKEEREGREREDGRLEDDGSSNRPSRFSPRASNFPNYPAEKPRAVPLFRLHRVFSSGLHLVSFERNGETRGLIETCGGVPIFDRDSVYIIRFQGNRRKLTVARRNDVELKRCIDNNIMIFGVIGNCDNWNNISFLQSVLFGSKGCVSSLELTWDTQIGI